jgi:DNA-binding transcriptional ArsR family regulator
VKARVGRGGRGRWGGPGGVGGPGRLVSPAEVDAVLAGLAEPTRRRLLELLASAGGATATAAARELPVSRQAVVKHLAVLTRAGLVEGERRGREVIYGVRPAAVESAVSWLTALAAEWDARLAVIKSIAEGE